jgi:hypothetical protein
MAARVAQLRFREVRRCPSSRPFCLTYLWSFVGVICLYDTRFAQRVRSMLKTHGCGL